MNINKKSDTKKQITSMDVARLAGVSQASVSRVFNPAKGRNLKQETRDKVLNAARELGYKPNAIARSLISKQTEIIGIVMGNKDSQFYSELLTKFTRKIQESGNHVLLFNIEPEHNIDNIIDRVLQYQVDSLIITSAALSTEVADECARRGTPVVFFNRFVPGLNVNAVYCDYTEAGKQCADYLLDNGHKKIAWITGQNHPAATYQKIKGFFDRLIQRGINECIEEYGDYSYQSGYNSAKSLLEAAEKPDAIFCANDIMAMGAMDAARLEYNIKIPEELSIISIDDTSMASWPAYSLTTMGQPLEDMMNASLEIIQKKYQDPDMEPIVRMFKMELVKRNSVRIIKNIE